MLATRVQATIQRGLFALDEARGNSSVRQRDGDAAPHRAGADHRGALNVRGTSARLDVGNTSAFALREEDVPQRARFQRVERLGGDLRFEIKTLQSEGDVIVEVQPSAPERLEQWVLAAEAQVARLPAHQAMREQARRWLER